MRITVKDARTFAREGATVFLAGRTHDSMEVAAAAIREAGGTAEVGVVDALDRVDFPKGRKPRGPAG